MHVGSVFKNDKNLYGGESTHQKTLQRSLTVQLSGDISISEEQPYQLKMSAMARGRKKGLQAVFFRMVMEFVFSVTLLFLKRLL